MEIQNTQNQAQLELKNGMSPMGWIITVLSGIYVVSPLDFIPDTIPLVGWMDDVLAAVIGISTVLKAQLSQANTTLAFMLKTLRFISFAIWGLLGMSILIFGALIYQIFTSFN